MKYNKRSTQSPKNQRQPTSYKVLQKDTLLSSLINNLPKKTRKILKAVLKDRQVSVDGKSITQFDHMVYPGQHVDVSWERVGAVQHPRELNIVHLDEDLIVINKPAGLLTVATDKEKRKTAYSMLSNYVKMENSDNKIFVIHRLDRETSGLLMFARSETVKHQIQKTWETSISQRTYVGVVEGDVEPATGTVTSYLKESSAFIVYSSQNKKHGKRSVTHYKKIKSNKDISLLQINLETGRKHQIRVHMQDISHPVIGDKKYGSGLNIIGRMGLHAQILAFTHPRTGQPYRFDAGIPGKFLNLF